MTIYERIKALRIERGLSQLELANKVGYQGRSAISKVENGERDISQSMIEVYAKALDVSPTYLLYGEETDSDTPTSDNDRIIIDLIASLSDSKKVEAINYLRYLSEHSDD